MPVKSFSYQKKQEIVPGQFAANLNWLRIHHAEYMHKWVALSEGKLIISGDTCEDINPYIVDHSNEANILRVHIGYEYIPE